MFLFLGSFGLRVLETGDMAQTETRASLKGKQHTDKLESLHLSSLFTLAHLTQCCLYSFVTKEVMKYYMLCLVTVMGLTSAQAWD